MQFTCDLKNYQLEFFKENAHSTTEKINDKALRMGLKLVQSIGKKNNCYYFDCYRKGEPRESQSEKDYYYFLPLFSLFLKCSSKCHLY